MKRALITGITGQDGSYLARLLLRQGYQVHGLARRSSSVATHRLDEIYQEPHESDGRLVLHYGDMSDGGSIRRALSIAAPDEVYNLAAQSHVMVSFENPEYTADIVAAGALRLFEAVREQQMSAGRPIRVYQAGSSEMFGGTPPPQNEKSPFYPRSPYAAAKAAAHHFAVNQRESHGSFIANGIMFNHESPFRGENFVTRKITRGLARIKTGLLDKLHLGNLDAQRDWGFAGDYVEAMWLMLQQETPEDYVIGTGEQHSVRDFLHEAGRCLDLDWESVVEIDPRFVRPAEVHSLLADPTKAREKLGWRPRVGFSELVRMMCEHDLDLARREADSKGAARGAAPVRD